MKCGKDVVVPVAVVFRRLEPDSGEFLFGDFDSGRVTAGVEFGFDSQALGGRGAGDQLDNDLVADQRPAAPVLSDVAEHSVFDFVPFARPWWKVTDMDCHSESIGQFLQRDFPQPCSASIAAPARCGIARYKHD